MTTITIKQHEDIYYIILENVRVSSHVFKFDIKQLQTFTTAAEKALIEESDGLSTFGDGYSFIQRHKGTILLSIKATEYRADGIYISAKELKRMVSFTKRILINNNMGG